MRMEYVAANLFLRTVSSFKLIERLQGNTNAGSALALHTSVLEVTCNCEVFPWNESLEPSSNSSSDDLEGNVIVGTDLPLG